MLSHTNRILFLVLVAVLAGIATRPGNAQVLVSPFLLASFEGNTNSITPFDFGIASNTVRYQQVYNEIDFRSITTPEYITRIAFRPDALFGAPFSATFPDVQIRLSTAVSPSDFLSSTFANNVGADNTLVYSGPLTLSSAYRGPANGPKDFDIVINFTAPFLYRPTTNLLLDVRNFGGALAVPFDAHLLLGDSVSSVASTSFNGVNDPTGDRNTFGLVTQFTFTPVPEPAIAPFCILLGVTGGLFALSLRGRRCATRRGAVIDRALWPRCTPDLSRRDLR